MSAGFLWRDAGRVAVLRSGVVEEAPELLGEHGFDSFELLSTERALAEPAAAALALAAERTHRVAAGQVPELAAALLSEATSRRLVAYGGGRVIDTAKAIASVSGAEVAAIPTTLSGAEMTAIHRLPAGAEGLVRGMVRPALALADPEVMTGQGEPQLRASAINALAHGADSLYTPLANPVSRMAALRGAALIATALDEGAARDRAALAEGSILCGYAIDSGGFALHHVICQTLVRICGSPHAETNAAMLPHTMAFVAPRAPEQIDALAEAIGAEPEDIESRIRRLGGDPPGLGALGADRTRLDEAVDSMLARPELGFGPQPPNRDELVELIDAAW
ncbi:MAG TPA: iron-containing alcohol dehydrogenase [Solirubrobacterales bacterium]|nr:iron-containing alcohol dehydrogenase [Solirubrobacterales bacterium]